MADPSAGPETPRDAYEAACDALADTLQADGFAYAKSARRCRRTAGDFIFQVAFQSSRYHAAGVHVGLKVYGTVLSPKLKKWRAARPPLRAWDVVAGGQVGNLQPRPRWMTWELADPGRRDAVVAEAVGTIRELALPYFARFEDLGLLVSALIDGDLPAMDVDRVVEFLLCFADESAARRAAKRFLNHSLDESDEYGRALRRYADEGLPKRPTGSAEYLAFASLFLGLGDVTGGSP